MNAPIVIQTSGLSKSFGATVAVAGLELSVRRGVLYGLVGPDGSGKTTTLRMLAGIMDPTSGDALVAGRSILTERERVKEKIGYMSQRFGLYEDLTVMENIEFYADIYDVPGTERTIRFERLLGFSKLAPFRTRLAGALSGGMKQKLGLACALVHTPEVLLLDEPTNGVDPVSRREFWKILYDLLKEGVTIFVSTSYLDEAERCTRIGLLYNGRLIREDDPLALRRSYPLPVIEIWCGEARRAGSLVNGMPGVAQVSIYGDRMHVTLERDRSVESILERLQREEISVIDHRSVMPSLEDVFITLVQGLEAAK
jgi:ABC-2 type transport system ATP-binding protein